MTNKDEANELLRAAYDLLGPFKGGGSNELKGAQDLREKIGRYFANQQTVASVDTSTVATDLLSVNSGANGFSVDQALQRVKDLNKA